MKIVSCHTADSKPVKQEVSGTVILPLLVFLGKPQMSIVEASVSKLTMRNAMQLNGNKCATVFRHS